MTSGGLQAAEREADGLLAPISLNSQWVDCTAPVVPAACGSAHPRSDLIVRILPKALEQADANALRIAGHSGDYDTAFIFYDRILALRTQTRLLHVVLGHVLAHEITHLLAPEAGHSASGIMRASWSANDLDVGGSSCHGLSRQVALLMHQQAMQRISTRYAENE